MIMKIFTHEKKKFWLMIQNAVSGTCGKALRLLGNDPVTSRVGQQRSSWPSPSFQISRCVSPCKAPLLPSRGLPSRSVFLWAVWQGIYADLPAGLGAHVLRLESPTVYLGSPELPGASSSWPLCVECQ